jgi:hypothetical protein
MPAWRKRGADGVVRRKPAKGWRHKNGALGMMTYYDDETFAQIEARAAKHNTSFGEQVRLLVEWGLQTAEESNA